MQLEGTMRRIVRWAKEERCVHETDGWVWGFPLPLKYAIHYATSRLWNCQPLMEKGLTSPAELEREGGGIVFSDAISATA